MDKHFIKKFSTYLILVCSILYVRCDSVEINIISSGESIENLMNCSGTKIDLMVQQDSGTLLIFHGGIENGVIKFSAPENAGIDFNKKVSLRFNVTEETENKACFLRMNSSYEVKNIMLKRSFFGNNRYEIELNRFMKLY